MTTAQMPASPPAPAAPATPTRPTMLERRQAWARHRREMTRLITAKVDWVPVLIFASILMTPEARLDLAGFQLYPYRLALIASLPFVAIKVARHPLRFGLADAAIIAAASWMFISTLTHYPLDVAVKSGGAVTLDTLAAYFAGRVFFRSALDLRRFLYRISPLVLAVGAILFLESISHRYLLRPFVGAITGNSPDAILNKAYEIRSGFLRATGPFLHPIAAGLFCASLVPLFIAADLPRRRWMGLAGATAGIFSLSSAGIGSIAIGLVLGLYDYFQRRARLGWWPVIGAVLACCFAIEAFTTGGLIKFVIRYAALNPQTGYFRLAIWEYGSADVMRRPWFGIGYFESYSRPRWMASDSVDNYWLLLALRYGVPCAALTLVGAAWAVVSVGRARLSKENGALTGRRMATGLCVSIVLIYVSILSVSPWGAEMAWFVILLGMACGLADQPRKRTSGLVGQSNRLPISDLTE